MKSKKGIIIRCVRCNARLFDIIPDMEELKKESPKEVKCYSCNTINYIRVERGIIRIYGLETKNPP